jgi:hypothetical protein
VVALCLVVAGLAGCSSVRSSLGTASGTCFEALPTAGSAVHHQGRLVGARLVTLATMLRIPGMRVITVPRSESPSQRVCLVAFDGSFDADHVDRPLGSRAGHAAIVVIGYPHRGLVATVIVGRLPQRFGHLHLGGG